MWVGEIGTLDQRSDRHFSRRSKPRAPTWPAYIYLICFFFAVHGLPAGYVCVRAACGTSATSKRHTPGCLKMHFWDVVIFKRFSGPLVKCSSYGGSDQLTMLRQQDAHRNYVQKKGVVYVSHVFSKPHFFCNSWETRTLARMSTGIHFGSPTNQLQTWAGINYVYSNQTTSPTNSIIN